MTSEQPSVVAVDSMCLLSASIGKAAQRIFTETCLLVVTTEQNVEEVEEYLPGLAEKYHVPFEEAQIALSALPLEIKTEAFYSDRLQEAEEYLADRDPPPAGLAGFRSSYRKAP